MALQTIDWAYVFTGAVADSIMVSTPIAVEALYKGQTYRVNVVTTGVT